jgi:hypothetical protein
MSVHFLRGLFFGRIAPDPIPRQGYRRVMQLLRDEWAAPSYGIMRLNRLVITALGFVSLTPLIDEVAYLFIKSTEASTVAVSREIYYIMQASFVVVVLSSPLRDSSLAVYIVMYCIADILWHLIGGALVWSRHSIDPQRSLILALLNYGELIGAFAILYYHYDCLSWHVRSAPAALYFSFLTSTTLGFGEIVPNSHTGKIIASAQLGIFALFVLIVLSMLLGRNPGEIRKDASMPRAADAERASAC